MTAYANPAPSTRIVARTLGTGAAPVEMASSYEVCRQLNRAHGRTYYFATQFLPATTRRHVYALYGFARYADDLVDHLDLGWDAHQRRAAFEAWTGDFLDSLASGETTDPVLLAVVQTVQELGITHDDLHAFLRSMAMDLTVTRYATYDDLSEYVYGSAGVIGAMMLPVLGAEHPQARDRAMDLGIAFQLTNFLRDVGEDWDRGRIYLPLEDLDLFGVTEMDFRVRHMTPGLRRLLAFEVARTRELYRRAEAGWTMLAPSSRACVRIAHRLYAEILDRIEGADYDVFNRRAAVPTSRKLTVAARELTRPTRARTPSTATDGAFASRCDATAPSNGVAFDQIAMDQRV